MVALTAFFASDVQGFMAGVWVGRRSIGWGGGVARGYVDDSRFSTGPMFHTSCSRSPTPEDFAARVMSPVGSLITLNPFTLRSEYAGKHTKGVTSGYSNWLALFANLVSLYNVVIREQVQSILRLSSSHNRLHIKFAFFGIQQSKQ